MSHGLHGPPVLNGRPAKLLDQVAHEVEMVVSALSPLAGQRTVWIDPYGRLWHGIPGLELPHDRWRTVGTFFRPSHDAVTTAVLDVLRERRMTSRSAA